MTTDAFEAQQGMRMLNKSTPIGWLGGGPARLWM